MKSMSIGSYDVNALLAGKTTKAHRELWNSFFSCERTRYNSMDSPIDQFRTGAIIEERYYSRLPDYYFTQVKVVNREQDVLHSTLDFAVIEDGIVTYFEELKSINFDDFRKLESIQMLTSEEKQEYISKTYKGIYNQVQKQLYDSGLESCVLVFVVVYSYEDSDNINREIRDNELIKFTISRDKQVISMIRKRAGIFQSVKDFYKDM